MSGVDAVRLAGPSGPRLLLTHVGLDQYAGSEIVVLELIEWFAARGWRVDLFTSVVRGPMARELAGRIAEGAVRVITIDDAVGLAPGDYRLVWINHSFLPTAFVEALGDAPLEAPLVWHHMSSFVPIEMPLLWEAERALASVVTCMAPVARDRLVALGIPPEAITIVDNPAPDAFIAFRSHPRPSALTSLLVVSNHLPSDVRGAIEALEHRGVRVTTVGALGVPQRVTPELIAAHDAVVTIGKTTQYALTVGAPVFNYDRFGGVGWIDDRSLERAAADNFSGRLTGTPRTVDALVDELLAGYDAARRFAAAYEPTAKARWSLTRQLESLLDALFAGAENGGVPRALAPAARERTLALCQHRDELWSSLRRLENAVADAQVYAEQVASMRQSVSWRLTRPLRWVRRRLGR